MKKTITQAEARRLKKQVRDLESKISDMTRAYGREYPGTYVGSINIEAVTAARLDTAKRFGAVLIARQTGNEVHFYGVQVEP